MSAFTDAVEWRTRDLTGLSVGYACCCEVCQGDLNMSEEEIRDAQENDELPDEGGISRHPCECCGSGLAGTRYAAHGFDADDELNHLEVCVDCLCYIANGDEPETW